MLSTTLLRRASASALLTIVVLLPSIASAVYVPKFQDQVTVTRGDFLRSAVKIYDLDVTGGQDITLPYEDIPGMYMPYVRAAYKDNALGTFGTNLNLAHPITRGEALRVLADLLDTTVQKSVSFRDVHQRTPEEKAVQLAVQYELLEPLNEQYFGIRRRISGSDTDALLSRASALTPGTGPEASPAIPAAPTGTIRLRINSSGVQQDAVFPKQDLIDAVWSMLNRDYLRRADLDAEEASYKAVEALVESLDDPYTRFLRPQSSRNFQTQIQGEISGIGAQVEDRSGILTVVTPLTGSPAEAAGLLPNDQILEVDGESIKDVQFMNAVEMIRGEKGSLVTLTVNRSGIVLKITVKRDVVRVPEIEISWQGNIALIRLMQFGRRTETELRDELKKVQERLPKGVILDLRNNPGGLLNAASTVLSNFVSSGTKVAIIKNTDDERTAYTDREPTIDPNVPMVVLVNEGSASASEIVAGALQDHKRARIVGGTTFGKGTVQEVLSFQDGSSLKMTVAEWLTPNGRAIDGVGIEPDVVVDFASERDAQLLRALELLR